jgi:hypothetical protein
MECRRLKNFQDPVHGHQLPVTAVEYPITNETLIVSTTDRKGKLTYFHDQFVAALGVYRTRPICWRSTPPSRRRGRAMRGGGFAVVRPK